MKDCILHLQNTVGKSISYCIRLMHPISFSHSNFYRLYESITTDSKCDWELIHKIKSADSFLGKINLGTVEGKDIYLDAMLYKDDSNDEYTFFRLKNSVLQKFKSLFFTPEKNELCLRMLSCEFIPFQASIGFISMCFCIVPDPQKEFKFSDAVTINYSLPFIRHSFKPFILRIKDAKKSIVEKKTNIPTLFQKAYDSLMGHTSKDSTEYVHVQDCWDVETKFNCAGSLDRLFLMSYLVIASDDQTWENTDGESLRHFYHQITRWSEDGYKHSIEPQVYCNSPEKTRNSYPTRFCAFSERGITCIGLGANEFERNNFLPKFRESYYFALLVAWYFSILKKNNFEDVPKELLKQLSSFPTASFFEERPRQEFFETCLEFKKLNKDFPAQILNILQSPTPPTTTPSPMNHCLSKKGEYWEIVYENKTATIKDCKGIGYIAYLLENKNKEVSSSHLYWILNRNDENHSTQNNQFLSQTDQEGTSTQNSSHPILDQQAIENYKKALAKLEEDSGKYRENLNFAKEKQDSQKQRKWEEKIAKTKQEIQFIKDELKKNVGYKGNRRKFDDDNERKRKNVSNAIKSTIERIQSCHASLGSHLSKSIQTGLQCSYSPEQNNIAWSVNLGK